MTLPKIQLTLKDWFGIVDYWEGNLNFTPVLSIPIPFFNSTRYTPPLPPQQ
jgi:hypothetical protein